MKNYFLIFILIFMQLFLFSCTKIRDSAGVSRKSIDEFKIVENPPLVIPPDFNLLPPEQLDAKNIDETESELAQEILFGLDDNNFQDDANLSTIDQILKETNANNVSNDIRQQINEDFSNEKSSSIYQIEWEREIEVLDAIKESERIREQLIDGKSISEGEVPTVKQKIKTKKRKFFFF